MAHRGYVNVTFDLGSVGPTSGVGSLASRNLKIYAMPGMKSAANVLPTTSQPQVDQQFGPPASAIQQFYTASLPANQMWQAVLKEYSINGNQSSHQVLPFSTGMLTFPGPRALDSSLRIIKIDAASSSSSSSSSGRTSYP